MLNIIHFLVEQGCKIEVHTDNLMSFWISDDDKYSYLVEHLGRKYILTKHIKYNGVVCSPEMTRTSPVGIIKLMQDLIF